MSIYRVATANTYDTAKNNIQRRQSDMASSQSQLSSGKRVLQASDDSVAAMLSERTLNRQARTEADLRGLEASRRSLEQGESVLGQVSDLFGHFKELLVRAGDGALSASDKRSVAEEMERVREQLSGIANQKDTAGKPLFAGLGTLNANGNAAVDKVGAAVNTAYGPDGRWVEWEGQRGQVAPTDTSLPTGVDGYSIFKGAQGLVAAGRQVTSTPSVTGVNIESVQFTGTPNATVFDTTPLSQPPTQDGKYSFAFDGTTWTAQRTDAGTPAPAPVAVAVTASLAAPYTNGQQLTLSLGAPDNLSVDMVVQDADVMNRAMTATPPQTVAFNYEVTAVADRDIWETMDMAIGALQQGYSGGDLNRLLGVAHDQLAVRQDALLSERGKLGDWMNRADNLQTNFTDRKVAYEKENSSLVDVDMVDAVSKFQLNQTAYQAALQSYAQVQKMSMFDYMR